MHGLFILTWDGNLNCISAVIDRHDKTNREDLSGEVDSVKPLLLFKSQISVCDLHSLMGGRRRRTESKGCPSSLHTVPMVSVKCGCNYASG